MKKPTSFEPRDSERKDVKQTVRFYIAEIDRARLQMMADQNEIDRLKLETREILARLKAR